MAQSYSFFIRKSDHPKLDGTYDLHVHVYYNAGKSRKLLGRYRIPSLEPIFPGEPELNGREIEFLRAWIQKPEQVTKLNDCLKSTVFDSHLLGELAISFGELDTDQNGETYIKVRIPVTRRIASRRT